MSQTPQSSTSRTHSTDPPGEPCARRGNLTRSRAGCQACKSQKKKCDQIRPSCTRCKARRRSCLYPGPVVWQPPSSVSQTTDSSNSYDPPFSPPSSSPNIDANGENGYVEQLSLGLAGSLPRWSPQDATPFASLTVPSGLECTGVGFIAPTSAPDWPATQEALVQAFLSFTDTNVPSINTQQTDSAIPELDPTLWAFLIGDAIVPAEEPCGEDDGSLLNYFRKFTTYGVVLEDGLVRRFFHICANRATQNQEKALMHAILCVSAQHVSNRNRKDQHQNSQRHAQVALKHREQALYLLQSAPIGQEVTAESEVTAAILILLILAAMLKGEGAIIPGLLAQTSTVLANCLVTSDPTFVPITSALHSLYTILHSLSTNQTFDTSAFFPERNPGDVWAQATDDVLQTVAGLKRNTLLLLVQANNIVLEHIQIVRVQRRVTAGARYGISQLVSLAKASSMEADLTDLRCWETHYIDGLTGDRVQLGHRAHRIAILVMLLIEVFDLTASHARIVALVGEFVDLLNACPLKQEVGLSWPYVIVASLANAPHREGCVAFIARASVTGSAMPRLAASIVEELWRYRDQGVVKSWRECISYRGSPIII